jgi:LAS superfamily LD-carboxypeptidase LdcB
MKRRDFVRNASLTSLAIGVSPALSAQNFLPQETYTLDELTGKAALDLYGEGKVQLRKQAYEAYIRMKRAAYSAGFGIKMISSYRSYDHQTRIWEGKYIRYTESEGMTPDKAIEKIVEYSTIPGTSRHHWGTEIDIIDGYPKSSGDVLVAKKFEAGGPFEAFKKWLDKNANSFGFYLVYTNDPDRRGFKHEPWHYSYAPLSVPMLKQFRKTNILKVLSQESFEGADQFSPRFLKSYIHDHILDINPTLL